MTDREKLPWLLCKAHSAVTEAELENDDLSYADALEIEADVLIAHGVVISEIETTTQKWISVEERLPEHGEAVLCMLREIDRFAVFVWNDQVGMWVDYKAWKVHRSLVTHWMPLPALPKEV